MFEEKTKTFEVLMMGNKEEQNDELIHCLKQNINEYFHKE